MVLLCILAAATLGATHEVPMRGTPELKVQVEAPETWAFSSEGFSPDFRRHTYAVLHNRPPERIQVFAAAETTVVEPRPVSNGAPTDSLRVWPGSGISVRIRYDERAFEEHLPPGTVYVDIGVFEGGPAYVGPYVWSQEDSPEARLEQFAANREPAWDNERSSGYRVGFSRWGRSWSVWIAARKPFREADLEEAFRIVDSVRFPRAPVVANEQAIEAATASLPPHMQRPADGVGGCDLPLHYDSDVERIGEAFRVEFQRLDGTEARTLVESRTYRVDRDGTVTELGRRGG